MKPIDYYTTCSNTQIQQSEIKKLLNRKRAIDYIEDDLNDLAITIAYCCKNYKSEISCQCKNLPECKMFNELIKRYSELLKQCRREYEADN